MKRFVLLMIFLIGMVTAVFSDPIKFLTPKVLEFGKVPQGEEISGAFKILITSKKVLEIESIRPGCGCTVVKDLPMTYNPGDTLVIPFTLNTRGFFGVIRKPITVTFKDLDIPAEKLYIGATIFQDLSLSKRYLIFKDVKVDPSVVLSDSLYFLNASDKDVHITEASFSSDLVTVDYDKRAAAPNDSLLIKVRLHPMMAFNAPVYIRFKTDQNEKTLPGLELRVYLDIRE